MHDCHIHSSFSGDSIALPTSNCLSAIQNGLAGITFTDHLDLDFPNANAFFNINFNEYFDCLNTLKNHFSSNLNIFIGLEIGFQPTVLKKSEDIINQYNFDQIIFSLHVLKNTSLQELKHLENIHPEKLYLEYLTEMYNMLSTYTNYDILGHLDIIKRYVPSLPNSDTLPKECFELIDEILKLLVKHNKALEVNTSGFRYNLFAPNPNIQIIKRFKELGGKFLCMSSDSHFDKEIGYKFLYLKELFLNCGFDYYTYYDHRQPVCKKIT